jgi:hypothetical protein
MQKDFLRVELRSRPWNFILRQRRAGPGTVLESSVNASPDILRCAAERRSRDARRALGWIKIDPPDSLALTVTKLDAHAGNRIAPMASRRVADGQSGAASS